MGDRCKTEGRMDKMDLSQIVIKFVVIEHGLIKHGTAHVCDNSTPMTSTLAITTNKVLQKLQEYQKYLCRHQYQK